MIRALLLSLLLTTSALAVEPRERLADPALEARARAISQGLRCLVCRNESIDDSNADLARDIRLLLRERLTAGDTNAQAQAYIVARYGQYVLLSPPVTPETYILWFAPPTVLALGAASAFLFLRRRPAPPAPLSAEEQSRLAALLREPRP
jgi:cytochrome c-type biogenesis protein CcmH